jgi:PBP superfamily domain
MCTLAKLSAIALAGVLIVMPCRFAGAQVLTPKNVKDLAHQAVQAVPKEVLQQIKHQLVTEIKKDLVAELKKELVASAKTQAHEVAKQLTTSENSDGIKAALAAITGSGNENAYARLVALARQFLSTRSNSPNGGPAYESSDKSQPLRGHPIAIVTNTSNPVSSLTIEQIQKLYTGEYTNWNQVGGRNLPVKVVVWRDSLDSLESLMKSYVAPGSIKLPYLSLMIPAVDSVKGAIGFLPATNMEQLKFVVGHKALKKVGVKTDDEAAAVIPSLEAVKEGSYPVVADTAPSQPAVHMEKAISLSLNGL